MNASAQPRIPAGAPKSAGGQWAAAPRREAAVDLSEDREAALASGEPVPAIFTTGDRVSERADRWWDTQASIAEWAGEGAAFPKMPGDWTPRRTVGTADSGLRRTHRMTYSGNGFSLRMPSATSIRSFSAAGRGAFDVPVDAVDERGRAITAWIRAVQHKPGHWSVSGLGFGGVADAKVSEAVASVLESRRPTRALRQAGDLIEKHRQRLADRGEELQRVRSGWIAAVGYSDVDRILLMQTRAGTNVRGDHVPSRTYGTHVSRAVFEELRASDQPGTIYNRLVKGNPGQMVRRCGRCGRSYAASRTHTCPAPADAHSQPVDGPDESAGRRQALRGLRRRRSHRRGRSRE